MKQTVVATWVQVVLVYLSKVGQDLQSQKLLALHPLLHKIQMILQLHLHPSADVSMGSNKLTNVTDPEAHRMPTKNYVDTTTTANSTHLCCSR